VTRNQILEGVDMVVEQEEAQKVPDDNEERERVCINLKVFSTIDKKTAC
jgi:hypothetical protein